MKALVSHFVSGACGALLVLAVQYGMNGPSYVVAPGGNVAECVRAKRLEIVDDSGKTVSSLSYSIADRENPLVVFTMGPEDAAIGQAMWFHSCRFGANAICWKEPHSWPMDKLVMCKNGN